MEQLSFLMLYILFSKRFCHSKLISLHIYFFFPQVISRFIYMLWHCCSLLLQADKIDFIISLIKREVFYELCVYIKLHFLLIFFGGMKINMLTFDNTKWHRASSSTSFFAPTHFHLRSHQIRFSYFTKLFNDDDDENIGRGKNMSKTNMRILSHMRAIKISIRLYK